MKNSLLKIILADDDESTRTDFTDALEELTIKSTVHTVNDGVELMEYLGNEDTPVPYLLFLDLNMPRKDGIQCLKEIRSSLKLKEIIVAVYSNSSHDKDVDETFVNGANIYIRKPNNYSTLKQVLDKVVRAANIYREPPFNKANFVFML